MGAQVRAAAIGRRELRVAIAGHDPVHGDAPPRDAAVEPPVLDGEHERVAVASYAPVRMRLGAERQRLRRALAQLEPRARFYPCGLLGGARFEDNLERGRSEEGRVGKEGS